MSVIAELAIFPLDKGESLSAYVIRAVEIITKSGLPHAVTPMGTCIEGRWEEVMDVITQCFRAFEKDCNRVYLTLKIDWRKAEGSRMNQKIASLQSKLAEPPSA
jgi:uncharacterized protein (TIGR00106 family)